MALEGALRFPTAFDVLGHVADNVDVGEVVVSNPRFTNKELRHIRLPSSALILSIRRDEAVLIPHGETVLQDGDSVALIGSPQAVMEAVDLLAGNGRL
jgi:Trk K+ transport system NAD-binding subunit